MSSVVALSMVVANYFASCVSGLEPALAAELWGELPPPPSSSGPSQELGDASDPGMDPWTRAQPDFINFHT